MFGISSRLDRSGSHQGNVPFNPQTMQDGIDKLQFESAEEDEEDYDNDNDNDDQNEEETTTEEQELLGELNQEDDILDEFPDVVIDRGEMIETTDDLDLLTSKNSPGASYLFTDNEDDSYISNSGGSCNGQDDNIEIDGLSNLNIILEYPELAYEYDELLSYNDELNDWFSSNDLKSLNTIKKVYDDDNANEIENNAKLNEKINKYYKLLQLGQIKYDLKSIICLCYLSMGSYKAGLPEDELKRNIKEISVLFIKDRKTIKLITSKIIGNLKKLINFKNDGSIKLLNFKLLNLTSNEFYYLLTILYFIITSVLAIKQENELLDDENTIVLSEILEESNLLIELIRSIDSWRWLTSEAEENGMGLNGSNNTNSATGASQQQQQPQQQTRFNSSRTAKYFKVRNVIMLINKLVLLQFGNCKKIESTKCFLQFKHEGKKKQENTEANKDDDDNENISPMDYYYYRNELITRYPTFAPPKYEISEILEISLNNDEDVSISKKMNSSSLFINSNHNFKHNKVGNIINNNTNVNNPPDIHIATPIPSPTLSPQHTGSINNYSNISELENGNKKKMFITQSNFPNLYPIEDEKIPFSINEACEIFYNKIQENFNSIQFTETFETFIKKENGLKKGEKNKFEYNEQDLKENPLYENEIKSLQRVENFYFECLPYLNSLVLLMNQILISNTDSTNKNKINIKKPFLRKELGLADIEKLEILKTKEIMLKNMTTLMNTILKWFRLSHLLKYEYLLILIFDSDYYVNLIKYLNNNNCDFETYINFEDDEFLINNKIVYCEYDILYEIKGHCFMKESVGDNCESFPEVSKEEQIKSIIELPDEASNRSMIGGGGYLLPPPFNNKSNIKINSRNTRFLIILNNLLEILKDSMYDFKLKRIFKFLELKPTETLRYYLNLFEINIWLRILKIIKLISCFNGKKWKNNNMDLISYVFLFIEIGIQDKWLNNLVGVSISERIKRSEENEHALRALVKFYNDDR